jgi:hypothetical protein
MSVKVTGSGGVLTFSATAMPDCNNVTLCGWSRIDSYPPGGSFSEIVILNSNDGSVFLVIEAIAGPTLQVNGSGGGALPFDTPPAAGDWFFWCMANKNNNVGTNGQQGYLLINGSTTLQNKNNFINTGIGATQNLTYLGDIFDEFVKGEIFALKVWDAFLSQAEIVNEIWSITPRRTANIKLWAPCWRTADVVNYSGTGDAALTPTNMSNSDNPPVDYRTIPSPRAPIS